MLRSCTLVVAASCLVACDAHGFMTNPKSRNSLVCDKLWPDYLTHYNNNNFWCKTDRESHCPYMPGKEPDCQGNSTAQYPGAGVPLAPYCSAGHDSRFPAGALDDLNKAGPVQAVYNAGDTVEMTWRVAADHGGKYSYRICLDGTDTEECFKKTELKNDKGVVWIDKPSTTEITDRIKIPEDISCERCTLSFRWDGKYESVIFASCADVQIRKNGAPTPVPPPGPTPTPPSPAPAAPTPPPAAKTCPKCGGGACGCTWVGPTSCQGAGDGSCCFKCCCGKD